MTDTRLWLLTNNDGLPRGLGENNMIEVKVCLGCGALFIPGIQIRDMGSFHYHRAPGSD